MSLIFSQKKQVQSSPPPRQYQSTITKQIKPTPLFIDDNLEHLDDDFWKELDRQSRETSSPQKRQVLKTNVTPVTVSKTKENNVKMIDDSGDEIMPCTQQPEVGGSILSTDYFFVSLNICTGHGESGIAKKWDGRT